MEAKDKAKCPFHNGNTAGGGTTNSDWWPNRLRLNIFAAACTFFQSPG